MDNRWTEHFLIYPRPKNHRSGQNQRVLCRGSVYRRVSVVRLSERGSNAAFFVRAIDYGNRDGVCDIRYPA